MLPLLLFLVLRFYSYSVLVSLRSSLVWWHRFVFFWILECGRYQTDSTSAHVWAKQAHELEPLGDSALAVHVCCCLFCFWCNFVLQVFYFILFILFLLPLFPGSLPCTLSVLFSPFIFLSTDRSVKSSSRFLLLLLVLPRSIAVPWWTLTWLRSSIMWRTLQ